MKIIVFGGVEMIGIPIVFKLQLYGHKVSIFTKEPQKSNLIFGNLVKIIHGNISETKSLNTALEGIETIIITLRHNIDTYTMKNIVQAAKRNEIKHIIYTSDNSVCEKYKNLSFVKPKFQAENIIQDSGIDFTIFRPTWFMEYIPRFIKDNKAFHIGKKSKAFHFLAADDYATIINRTLDTPQAKNKILYLTGPEKIMLDYAIKQYCMILHPNIKRVKYIPFWYLYALGFLLTKPEYQTISKIIKFYFSIEENVNPSQTRNTIH